jgi:hypothetical protein
MITWQEKPGTRAFGKMSSNIRRRQSELVRGDSVSAYLGELEMGCLIN